MSHFHGTIDLNKIKDVAERLGWEYGDCNDSHNVMIYKDLKDGSSYIYHMTFNGLTYNKNSTYKATLFGMFDKAGFAKSRLLDTLFMQRDVCHSPRSSILYRSSMLIGTTRNDLKDINLYADKTKKELWHLILGDENANAIEANPFKYIDDKVWRGSLVPSVIAHYAGELLNNDIN